MQFKWNNINDGFTSHKMNKIFIGDFKEMNNNQAQFPVPLLYLDNFSKKNRSLKDIFKI